MRASPKCEVGASRHLTGRTPFSGRSTANFGQNFFSPSFKGNRATQKTRNGVACKFVTRSFFGDIFKSMKIELICVPPGGGEAHYTIDVEMPAIPRPGDYITLSSPGKVGTSDFIVRRTWWLIEEQGDQPCKTNSACVEVEFAEGPFSSEEHLRWCDIYERRKGERREFEATAY